jgi:transcriptional regulator with XRE-family HTH domain
VKLQFAIGGTIRSLREQQGLTLRALSKRAYVSIGHISEIERGVKGASGDVLESITEALRISTTDFLQEVCTTIKEA